MQGGITKETWNWFTFQMLFIVISCETGDISPDSILSFVPWAERSIELGDFHCARANTDIFVIEHYIANTHFRHRWSFGSVKLGLFLLLNIILQIFKLGLFLLLNIILQIFKLGLFLLLNIILQIHISGTDGCLTDCTDTIGRELN